MQEIEEEERELSADEQLKAVLFQFIKLYERWSEDRQVAAKQGADLEDLVKGFTDQVKSFKEFEPKVRQQLANAIQTAMGEVAKKVSEETTKAATREIESTTRQLAQTVEQTKQALTAHARATAGHHFRAFFLSLVTAALMGAIAVWVLMPKLAFTDDQLALYQAGQVMQSFWPKLSKKEQQWLLGIASGKSASANTNINTNVNTDTATDSDNNDANATTTNEEQTTN